MSCMVLSCPNLADILGLSNTNTNRLHSIHRFFGASSYNRDLSNWDVGNVQDFQIMFKDASSFNQDLCEWSTVFNYDAFEQSTEDMFRNSNCTFQESPVEVDGGPFCASNCIMNSSKSGKSSKSL